MKKNYIIILLIIVIAICASYFYYANKLSIKWNLHDKLTYKIFGYAETFENLNSYLKQNMPQMSNKVIINAEMLAEIIDVADKTVTAKILIKNYEMKLADRFIEKNLPQTPFLVVFEKNGNIKEFIHPKHSIPSVNEKFESMIFNARFVVKANSKKWLSTEKDNLGTYTAEYNVEEKKYIKRKIRQYVNFNEKIIPLAVTSSNIQNCNMTITLPEDGSSWFKKIKNEINIDIYKQNELLFKVSSSIELVKTANNENDPFWKENTNRELMLEYVNRDFKKYSQEKKEDFEEIKKNNESIEELIDNNKKYVETAIADNLRFLKSQGAGSLFFIEQLNGFYKKNTQAYKSNIELMIKFLCMYPQESYTLGSLIKNTKAIPDDIHSDLMMVLERTGHEEAQDVLLSFLEIPGGSFQTLFRAPIALLGIKNITENNFRRLVSAVESGNIKSPDKDEVVLNNALLAIGVLTNSAINPNVKEIGKNYVKSRLQKIENLDNIKNTVIIQTAGNTGDPDFIKDIEKFIHSSHSYVKTEAINSLRLMPPEKVDPLLIKIFQEKDLDNFITTAKMLDKSRKEISKSISEVLKSKYDKIDDEARIYAVKCLGKDKDNFKYLADLSNRKDIHSRIKGEIFNVLPLPKNEITGTK